MIPKFDAYPTRWHEQELKSDYVGRRLRTMPYLDEALRELASTVPEGRLCTLYGVPKLPRSGLDSPNDAILHVTGLAAIAWRSGRIEGLNDPYRGLSLQDGSPEGYVQPEDLPNMRTRIDPDGLVGYVSVDNQAGRRIVIGVLDPQTNVNHILSPNSTPLY